jgi:hypothetical protein
MTKRNRKTLADKFTNGRMPTQHDFGDLIDSTVNIVDDGFDKDAQDGMKVAQAGSTGKLISFYDEITVRDPIWSFAFSMPDSGGGYGSVQNLGIFHGREKLPGITLAGAANGGQENSGAENPDEVKILVGVNTNAPEHEMDVRGVVASDGRIGREGKKQFRVKADGQWHPIIEKLDGCHAFEITAGVGMKKSGKYALLHAFALSTFNSKKGNITAHQAYFSSKCDQIELRWAGITNDYALQMRTRCDFGSSGKDQVYVRYYITRLWFDPFMEQCEGQTGSEPGAE